eukprot:5441956-Lingulodinium_polyedra.AAC.1
MDRVTWGGAVVGEPSSVVAFVLLCICLRGRCMANRWSIGGQRVLIEWSTNGLLLSSIHGQCL